MPEPQGLRLRMILYADSNHAGDSVTQQPKTGFIVLLNEALPFWMSKKQN